MTESEIRQPRCRT